MMCETTWDDSRIGPTIASKFVMYTVRCMAIGNVNPSQLELVAQASKKRVEK